MQFGVIVAHRQRQAVRTDLIGVALAIWGIPVPIRMIFASKLPKKKAVSRKTYTLLRLLHHTVFAIISIFPFTASETIIRDCLSSVRALRTDIPADHYEGCRKAATDVRLAHYVFNNTMKELDIRRDHFDSTEFCFCFLDHRCNSATALSIPIVPIVVLAIGAIVMKVFV